MKSKSHFKTLLGFFLLVAFAQHTTAKEAITIFEPFLPNRSASYTEHNKISITNDGGKTSGTVTNKYQISTSKLKENGELDVTVKSLSVQMTIDGKDETPTEGDNVSVTFTQLADGRFSNLPPQEQSLMLMQQNMLPRKMVVQKKYPVKIGNGLIALMQDTAVFADYDPKNLSTGWARLNKIDENYAWVELHLTIRIIDKLDYEMYELYGDPIPEDGNTVKIEGQLDATFKYNRKTHFIDERTGQYQSKVLYEGSQLETVTESNMKLTE